MKLTLIFLSECIIATGLNGLKSGITELHTTSLREIAKFLNPVEARALSSSSRGLNEWSRHLVLKKLKNYEHLDRDLSWKLVYYLASFRAQI